MTEKIQPIHTSCENCCFAKWDDITQTGCEIHILDSFKRAGAKIIECYNDNKEFYIINGRKCGYYRSQKWKEEQSQKDLYAAARLEILPKYHLIIFAHKNIVHHINKIKNLRVESASVITDKDTKSLNADIKDALLDTKFTWEIREIKLEMERDKVIHEIIKKSPCQFTIICPKNIKQKTLNVVDKFIINDMGIFSLIIDGSNYIFPRSVFEYWYYRTAKNESILDVLKEEATHIYNIEDLA